MNLENVFNTLPGFKDEIGEKKDLEDYVTNALTAFFKFSGYKHVRVPLVEQQKFFSSEFVGTNPWPGWHPKSLFALTIKDYQNNYESVAEKESLAFLIPEVTVSVCRLVAKKLVEKDPMVGKGSQFKIYYAQHCYRNEIVSRLSERRLREFTQLGVEYMGVGNVGVDVEIFDLIARGLETLGFKSKNILIRINDVRLFNYLCREFGLKMEPQFDLKAILDEIATTRIKRDTESLKKHKLAFRKYLEKLNFSPEQKEKFEFFLADYIELENAEKLLQVFPKELTEEMLQLMKLSAEANVHTVIDPAVVRSQEYYNKVVFQMDILDKDIVIPEIGGGGRYDFLLNRMMQNEESTPVFPATGFAFSVERIAMALLASGIIQREDVAVPFGDVDIVVFSKDISKALQYCNQVKRHKVSAEVYFATPSEEDAQAYAHSKNAYLKII